MTSNLNHPAIDPGPLTADDLARHIAEARRQQHGCACTGMSLGERLATCDCGRIHAAELGDGDDEDPAALFIGIGATAVLTLIAAAIGIGAPHVLRMLGWING